VASRISHLDRSRGAAVLSSRLRARRSELEQVTLTRVYAIADPTQAPDPDYPDGLRAAVADALDYGLEGIDRGAHRPPVVPPSLLIQARLAAQNGIGLDTVLRRYFAGFALFRDFLVEEADGVDGEEVRRALRGHASLFDRLVAAIAEEHTRESERKVATSGQRQAELVRRLLDGEAIDASELGYEFDAQHLGAVAIGSGAEEALRDASLALDRRLFMVRRDEGAVWAWLGARRAIEAEPLMRELSEIWPPRVSLWLGEPGRGLAGWRLTHRQAAAALRVGRHGEQKIVRYADVALLAGILQDDLLAISLRQLYLEPLKKERDGGEALRRALQAYFAADRNVSSAAAALGIKRHTVTTRLRAVERRVGRSLSACATDIELALRLEDLEAPDRQRQAAKP
jgi:PucR C-terminal helix-turn-helix domain/GGDEF-like domain